jgi:WD40 repeat protein
VSNTDGELCVWDAGERAVRATAKTSNCAVNGLAWDRASQRFSGGTTSPFQPGTTNSACIWQSDGRLLARHPTPSAPLNRGWSNDDRQWVVSLANQEQVWLDPLTAKSVFAPGIPVPSQQVVKVVGAPHDERLLVVATWPTGLGRLFLVDLKARTAAELDTSTAGTVHEGTWIGDGQAFSVCLYTSTRTWIEIWDTATLKRTATFDTLGPFEVSPNGRYVMSHGPRSDIVEARNGNPVMSVEHGHAVAFMDGAWGPDSDHVAIATNQDGIQIHHVKPGYLKATIPAPFIFDLAWSPDGRLIVGGTINATLCAWAAPDWEPAWSHVYLAGDEWAVVSPGGKLIAASEQADQHLRYMVEHDDGQIETLTLPAFRTLAQRLQPALFDDP